MANRLGELVDSERHRNFVGRRPELRTFDEAIAGRSEHRVLFVYGPGGIGKTTLLLEFRARARAAGRMVVMLDGREIDPSPEGFEAAVVAALNRVRPGAAAGLLADAVLLVDGYEQLAPIDGWLRHEFIPALSAASVVVLGGRDAPAASWRVDAGWRTIAAIHRLEPFDPDESGHLLALAGVAAPQQAQLIALGRGHPLAMALLADVARTGPVPAWPTSRPSYRRCSTRSCAAPRRKRTSPGSRRARWPG